MSKNSCFFLCVLRDLRGDILKIRVKKIDVPLRLCVLALNIPDFS